MWQPPDTAERRQQAQPRSEGWSYSEPMVPGQRRYARRDSGFGVRKGSMQTGHMPEDDSNQQQQTDQAKRRFSTTSTCSSAAPPTACNGPINTTNHSGLRSSHSSEVHCGLRHEGAFETVRGSDAPASRGRNSLADAPKVVVTSMERIVSRFTGNNAASKSGDAAWSNHSKDESSMSDASISVASRSNNNNSSDLHTSGALGNTSGRPTLASDGNSSRLSLGDSLANITRRLSSIGTGRSKRSSLTSKRSSIDTNQDSAQERAREGGAAHGMNLADFGARTSRRSFSVPGLQDLRPAHDTPEKPARRHSSASQKDGEEMARLIVGFNGSGSFSSSGEGSMRGFLGWPKGSKSSGGGSDSDSDLRVSGNDSWQSLGSLDSLGLPVQREKDDRQRRRSSLVSVGETGPTHFEEGENDEAIQQLRRSSMDRSWKQS